jgi:hypothetical protein
MKRYRLLKDLPDAPAGTILKERSEDIYTPNGQMIQITPNKHVFQQCEIDRNPSFFQEITDERWKPTKIDERYFVIATDCIVDTAFWNDDPKDHRRYDCGNVFKSETEAYKVAQRVKQTLLDYQKEINHG